MDLSWLVRARWRMVGAWMWPLFVVLAVADGLIGHALPLAGDNQSVVGGLVAALILNLTAVVVVARPLGRLLRMRRRDLPAAIARDYAGAFGIVAVTLGFVAIGLAHQSTISGDRTTMRDAAARAAAYIGDHAPPPFRADAASLSTVAIQDDVIYRVCAANPSGSRQYCVVVNERRPLAQSVTPAGSESNQNLARGTN
jgi:hypothetical protein